MFFLLSRSGHMRKRVFSAGPLSGQQEELFREELFCQETFQCERERSEDGKQRAEQGVELVDLCDFLGVPPPPKTRYEVSHPIFLRVFI